MDLWASGFFGWVMILISEPYGTKSFILLDFCIHSRKGAENTILKESVLPLTVPSVSIQLSPGIVVCHLGCLFCFWAHAQPYSSNAQPMHWLSSQRNLSTHTVKHLTSHACGPVFWAVAPCHSQRFWWIRKFNCSWCALWWRVTASLSSFSYISFSVNCILHWK